MRIVSGKAGNTKILLLRSAGLAAMAAFVMASQAQAQDSASSEQVVVTGSRVIQSQLDAPTPTTALTANDLQNIGGGGSLSETLRELPQLAFSSSISTQTISTTGTGNNNAAFLNLRNLGSVRTLVLQDGVRLPPNGSLGSTDVNLIPEALVQRVDTVTGGASAAYGSDAVSGVVNYILDKKYVGTKARIEGGISTYGDNETTKLELTHGEDFDGGRLHVLASYEYFRNYGADNSGNREWMLRLRETVPNPAVTAATATAANPARITFDNVHSYARARDCAIQLSPSRAARWLNNSFSKTTSIVISGAKEKHGLHYFLRGARLKRGLYGPSIKSGPSFPPVSPSAFHESKGPKTKHRVQKFYPSAGRKS